MAEMGCENIGTNKTSNLDSVACCCGHAHDCNHGQTSNHIHPHDHGHDECGDDCCCCGHDHDHSFSRAHKMALGICAISVVLMLGFEWLTHQELIASVLGVVAVIAGLIIVFPETLHSVKNRSIDINVLMLVAIVGAIYVGALEEAAMVLLLYIIGEYLEGRATRKSGDAISELAMLAPTHAQVVRDDEVCNVATDEIKLGETIRLLPGMASPLDGVISVGSSYVNDAAVTGESVAIHKGVGDVVYAASIIVDGACDVVTTSTVENSTLAKITEMVREARSNKSATETFVTRFARVYTPIVIFLALAVACIPSALTALGVANLGTFDQWVYSACTLLVISCPCAFVISAPATVVSALARAAQIGVLVKGGTFFEEAARVEAVAFDKTGTLTKGNPSVVGVMGVADVDTEDMIRIAGSLEALSTHPLACAIVQFAGDSALDVTDFCEQAGKGVSGYIDGACYVVGSRDFVADKLATVAKDTAGSLADVDVWAKTCTASIVVVARLGEQPCVLGALAVADSLRENAQAVVKALQKIHPAKRVVMLTGDNNHVAQAIASEVGVDEVYAGLLPQDKTTKVQELESVHGKVAFVGDGINDAPSLARAHVGIAMGGASNDAVLHSADVVLMADDLHALPQFFELSRKMVAILRQNIFFAVSVKVFTMILAILQLIPMWVAVFADSGLTVLVVMNGMRLLRTRLKKE